MAADIADAAVDHGDLPMRPQVHAADVADLQRPEALHVASGILHFFAEAVFHPRRTGVIDQEPHLDPFPRACAEGVRQPLAHLTRPPDVRLDVDRMPGPVDVFDQPIEKRAVVDDLRSVPFVDSSFGESDQSGDHGLQVAVAAEVEVRLCPASIRRPQKETERPDDGDVPVEAVVRGPRSAVRFPH